MKRGMILLGLLAMSASALSQVRMYVLNNGKRIGQAVASQKLLADGGKLVQLSMNLAGPSGTTVTLRSETNYDSKGSPTRMFHESIKSSPKERRTVTVTFSKAGAKVIEEVAGKRTVRDVPLVANAPTASKSEFWFIRDTPALGAADKRYRFNISSLEWELVTTTYGGLKKVALGGKQVQAHELKSTTGSELLGKAWVDGKGLPHVLELGQIKLERVPG